MVFFGWKGETEERKGRLLIKLSLKRMKWENMSINMEGFTLFELELQKGYAMLLFEEQGGYPNLYLTQEIRE